MRTTRPKGTRASVTVQLRGSTPASAAVGQSIPSSSCILFFGGEDRGLRDRGEGGSVRRLGGEANGLRHRGVDGSVHRRRVSINAARQQFPLPHLPPPILPPALWNFPPCTMRTIKKNLATLNSVTLHPQTSRRRVCLSSLRR
jgi:hypothetical protein